MRYLVPVALIFAVELLNFSALKTAFGGESSSLEIIYGLLFWSIPGLTTLYLLFYDQFWNKSLSEKSKIIVRTGIISIYTGKVFTLLILAIEMLRVVIWFAGTSFGWIPDIGFSPSVLLAQVAVISGLGLFLILIYGIIRNPYRYQLRQETIKVPSVKGEWKGLKIIQISDIHSGSFLKREPIKKAIEMINLENPDLVFFTGDLVNYASHEMLPFIDIFSSIESKYGIYSIVGNHDYGDYVRWPSAEAKKENFRQLEQIHKSMGWRLLLNDHEVIDIEGTKVGVIGVENYSAHPRFPKYGDLSLATVNMPEVDLKILLSHDPTHWEDEVIGTFKDINLTLSGHTHGFQFGIDIPGWFKWSPVQYVYKKWAGLYHFEGQYLYVNRGFGHLGYPGRVGILPEITSINLE